MGNTSIVQGVATQSMPLPAFPATLHGYEVFPLSPEWAIVETQIYRVIATEADSPVTQTRAIRDKVLRRWRIQWTEATETEAETIRAFAFDVRGSALPFWFDVVDPVAKPYDAPDMTAVAGGTLGVRTCYAQYTWQTGALESLPSYEQGTLALNSGELLKITVPEFPANVTDAVVYVGPTTDILYKQATTITPVTRTWTEPSTGYADDTAAPPTTNTLQERCLVHFGEDTVTVTRKSAKRYEIALTLEELWIENPRAYFATGAIDCAVTTLAGEATVPFIKFSGTIDAPAAIVDGQCKPTVPGPGVRREVHGTDKFQIAAATVCSSTPGTPAQVTADLLGTYYVAKTGSNGNPGTLASPFLTIQYAVTTAGTGDTIVVGPGTYAENVSIDAPMSLLGSGSPVISGTSAYGISATSVSTVTIDGFTISGQTYGIYATGASSWTITDCTICDQTTGGIYLSGTQTGTTYTTGTSHTITGNAIYRIGNVDDACGIRLETCTDSTVSTNQLWLIHRDAIRDTNGESNTIQSNWVQYAYVGVKVGVATTDCYVYNNYLDHCSTGVALMGCTGRIGNNRVYKNTSYYCFTGLNVGYYYAGTDYATITYNMWKSSGDRHVYYSEEGIGTHIAIDYNMYWQSGDRPTAVWVQSSATYSTISALQAGTTFEDHAASYSCGTTGGYGSSGVTQTQPVFTTVAMNPTAASHNLDLARRGSDFKAQTQWYSGTGFATNEYIVFDFGSTKTWNYAVLATYGDNCEHTPKNMHIDSSPDGSTWTTQKTVLNTWGGGFKWYKMAAPVSSRYVRLYMVDKFTTDDFTWTENELKFSEFLVGNEAGTGAISVSSLSTAWQRGKVYQLTAGAYGTLNFTTPESGTDYVEIRGGAGVTVEKVSMASSYLKLVDLVIYNTAAATVRSYLVDLVENVHDLYMDGCELKRPAATYLGRGVYATRGGNHDLTFVDCNFHDIWGPFYYGIGDTDVVFDNCTFKRNYSNSTEHSEGIDLNNSTRVTIKNCWMEDINGTAFIVTLNQPSNYIYIYNNIFKHTLGASNATGHGTISDNTEAAKSATSHHVYVYHNTFVTVGNYSGRSGITFWFGDDVLFYNNFFYLCTKMATLGVTDDYTVAYDCPASAEYTPATNDSTGSGNPFADTSYRLIAGAKKDGKVLAVAYAYDRDGVLRTHWHSGAYE